MEFAADPDKVCAASVFQQACFLVCCHRTAVKYGGQDGQRGRADRFAQGFVANFHRDVLQDYHFLYLY